MWPSARGPSSWKGPLTSTSKPCAANWAANRNSSKPSAASAIASGKPRAPELTFLLLQQAVNQGQRLRFCFDRAVQLRVAHGVEQLFEQGPRFETMPR